MAEISTRRRWLLAFGRLARVARPKRDWPTWLGSSVNGERRRIGTLDSMPKCALFSESYGRGNGLDHGRHLEVQNPAATVPLPEADQLNDRISECVPGAL